MENMPDAVARHFQDAENVPVRETELARIAEWHVTALKNLVCIEGMLEVQIARLVGERVAENPDENNPKRPENVGMLGRMLDAEFDIDQAMQSIQDRVRTLQGHL